MSQTNIQVPIEQRNHDEEVLKKRPILYGDDRFKPESPPGGPSSLGADVKSDAVVLCHGRAVDGKPAPDMLYLEQTTTENGRFKQHMSGRRYAGEQYNQGRNVGSTHLQMPAEPHHEPEVQREGTVTEGGITLPKDQ